MKQPGTGRLFLEAFLLDDLRCGMVRSADLARLAAKLRDVIGECGCCSVADFRIIKV